MRKRWVVIRALSVLWMMGPATNSAATDLLTPLQNQEAAHECGCALSTDSASAEPNYYFWSDTDFSKAVIGIRGKDQPLTFVSRTPSDIPTTVGQTYTEHYKARDLQVIVDYTITPSGCSADQEDCEVSGRSARVQINRPLEKQKKNLVGQCGC